MIRVRLLTLASVLALTALSAVAQAGPTITNKASWPNEISRLSQTTLVQPSVLERGGSHEGCRHLGGPKAPAIC